jgi:hypothetical protein
VDLGERSTSQRNFFLDNKPHHIFGTRGTGETAHILIVVKAIRFFKFSFPIHKFPHVEIVREETLKIKNNQKKIKIKIRKINYLPLTVLLSGLGISIKFHSLIAALEAPEVSLKTKDRIAEFL